GRWRRSSLAGTSPFTESLFRPWSGDFWEENSKREFFVALEKIEQTLADCEQTERGTGKKSRSNKRLVSQRRERARLEVADFRDELVERLPFCFDFLTQQAKPPQVIESSFTQLFSRAPKQNRTAQRPCASTEIDQNKNGRPSTIIKKAQAGNNHQ